MPLRLNAITNNAGSDMLANLLGPVFEKCNSAFATPDAKYAIAHSDMVDTKTGKLIGKFVFTIYCNTKEQRNEILDLDLVLINPNPTKLNFLTRLDGSSDSNEYYNAETIDSAQHLQIETVNRHTVAEDTLIGERDVFISVFPFELSVYKNISAFNKAMGFKKKHRIGPKELGLTTSGFSDTFISPSDMFQAKAGEYFSFLVGTVESFNDVHINIGNLGYDFVLAHVKTALGVVPVAMGREVFDLRKLKVGKLVAMKADLKADMSKASDFSH